MQNTLPIFQNWVAYKEPGATAFFPPYVAATISDKPLMAIAWMPPPCPLTPTYRHYLMFRDATLPNDAQSDSVWVAYSDNPTMSTAPWTKRRVYPDDLHPPWDPDTPNHYRGLGATPVVLGSGRIVVANRDPEPPENGLYYNDKLPYVIYSDDGGIDWQPNVVPQDGPVRVADTSGISASQSGDYAAQFDGGAAMPCIAVDRANDDVYVAFHARAAQGSTNTDIVISRSRNAGVSFPGDPAQFETLRLTEARLGLTPFPDGSGPDQVMPAIAIDACGAVNVMFYDTRNPDARPAVSGSVWADVYLVRITGFGSPSPVISQYRLTGTSFLVGPHISLLGHYHHMCIAGPIPRLYAAYIATAETVSGSNIWSLQNCFLHKISVTCMSDMNMTGFAEIDDVDQFLIDFGSESTVVDFDADGQVTNSDADLFWDSFVHQAVGS